MTDAQIIEKKSDQLRSEKLVISESEMKERAAEYEGIPLNFQGAVLGHRPGIIAPIGKLEGDTVASAGKAAARSACEYVQSGACCIAVESRWEFFSERTEYMKPIREDLSVPILACGYTIEDYQIYEALLLGADAILLIGRLLTPEAQGLLVQTAHHCGLQTVTLVGSDDEVQDAVKSQTDMVAASNISGPSSYDLELTRTLLHGVQQWAVGLSFGGVKTRKQLDEVASYGAVGALVEAAYFGSSE